MTLGAIIEALGLPPEARVDQRVPKTLLLEHGTPTAADRRQVQDGVEELRWVAALKPGNIGVPSYRDAHREYLEIAVLTLDLRPTARSARLVELVHRAVPYPVVLVSAQARDLTLSLAHKRFSQGEAGATVLDGELASISWEGACAGSDLPKRAGDCPNFVESSEQNGTVPLSRSPFESLAIGMQPRTHLLALYEGWREWTEAFRASRITGRFARSATPEAAAARREALELLERLEREISGLRAQAVKETQLNRRVELNLTLRRLEAERAEAIAHL